MEAKSLNILIIEDSVDDVELYTRLLGKIFTSPNIDFCHGSEKAKDILAKKRYDVILLDYNLPGINGLDFVRSIDPNKLSAAIIALTGQGSEAVAVEFMRLGVCDYIQKSDISQESLSYAINRALEHSYSKRIEFEKQQELSRFAHTVTHDLKAPLGRIESYAKLLSKANPEKNEQYVLNIQDDARYVREFLDKLLQFAEFGRVNVTKKQISLEVVVKKAISNLEVEIRKSSAKIEVSSMPEIYGHQTSLIQLFQNLIANAIKYCSKDPLIELTSNEESGGNIITIIDNGIGISAEEAKDAFEPFVRLSNDLNQDGLGLGLALCKAIVDEHRGQIEIMPGEKCGTKIIISFPKVL